MTDSVRLYEIQRRLDAATPGPWKAAHVAKSVYGTPIHGAFGAERVDEAPHIANAFRDADFIASAPEDIRVLLGITRDLRDALRVTLKELEGAEWEGSMADSTTCCSWCKRERPWDTPEQDSELSHDADCVWMKATLGARALLARIEETPQ